MTATIGQFIDYLTLELNYSPRTASAYHADLSRWEAWVTGGSERELDPASVTLSDLRLYLASLSRSRLSVRSIHRHVQSLRAYFKYLMREGIVEANPASDLQLAHVPQSLPVYVRQAEMQTILDDNPADGGREGQRDHLILSMLYNTGMRVSELCGMKRGDVDTVRCELRVIGKRNKQRIIPFGQQLKEELEAYIAQRFAADYEQAKDAPLFMGRGGKPLSREQAYKIVHRLLVEGGAHAPRLSPHVMRHCFATDMLNNGADLTSVRRLLGHASLESTQIYTHVSFSEMRAAYSQAHPRGKG